MPIGVEDGINEIQEVSMKVIACRKVCFSVYSDDG